MTGVVVVVALLTGTICFAIYMIVSKQKKPQPAPVLNQYHPQSMEHHGHQSIEHPGHQSMEPPVHQHMKPHGHQHMKPHGQNPVHYTKGSGYMTGGKRDETYEVMYD